MIQTRLLLPGITWLALMVLVFYTPITDRSIVYFECVPPRAFVHLFMFTGLVHIWLGILKKQLNFRIIRERAFTIVFSIALLLASFSELSLYSLGYLPWFNGWNLFFDILGATLGMGTFSLLYRSCY